MLPLPFCFTTTTAQAPHSPSAQPSLDPVSPRSRRKSSSVVCKVGSASTRSPLRRNSTLAGPHCGLDDMDVASFRDSSTPALCRKLVNQVPPPTYGRDSVPVAEEPEQ